MMASLSIGWLAQLDLFRGEPAVARDRVTAFLAESPAGYYADWLGHLLARAYLELGECDLAERTVDQAVLATTASDIALHMADALWAKGVVASRLGCWEEARQAFDRAQNVLGDQEPYRRARILAACGEMHAQQGQAEQARAGLRAALTIFRELGARPDAQRAECALGELSGAPTHISGQ
jgi:tetratricopeptide (TPR) repeat protein